MSMIEWNDDYSVKIKEIDDHHKKLISYINELLTKMKKGKGKDIINVIINKLYEYTVFHFSFEEKYMKEFNYPEYEIHRKEHDYFKDKINEFKEQTLRNEIMTSVNVMSFLVDWLLKHIANTDKKYSETFIKNGLK